MVLTATPLSFEFRWDDEVPARAAADATRGRLSLKVGGLNVWGEDGEGFSWTWIELLEYLARHWSFIEFEEIDPLGFGCLPHELRPAAVREWQDLSQLVCDRQEEALWNFELSHNLAAGVEGAWLPDVWLLRQGRSFSVVSGNLEVVAKAEAVLSTLVDMGDSISNRLKSLANDPRALNAVEMWSRRTIHPMGQLLEIATSLPARLLDEVRGDDDLSQFWHLDQSPSESELVALARSSGQAVTAPELRALLVRILGTEKRISKSLSAIESEASSLEFSGVPHEDGHSVARWLRKRLGNPAGRVEPEKILSDWNVEIFELALESSHLDAVAVWGPRHGPAIAVNPMGKHAQDVNGRRSTLAHEICHLLLDRQGALPLGEAIGGRVPERIEARARAFAAELLAPREIVGREVSVAADPGSALERLKTKFGASPEILAWQARNSGVQLTESTNRFLAGKVSRPGAFLRS